VSGNGMQVLLKAVSWQHKQRLQLIMSIVSREGWWQPVRKCWTGNLSMPLELVKLAPCEWR